MGKRGPKPLSAQELAARGSWRAPHRLKEEQGDGPRRRKRKVKSSPRRPLPADMAGWRTLCSRLPGYDPGAHADGYFFDAERAAAAIDWIETHCRHIKGELAGQLIRIEDFQRAVVANLFGWVDDEGFRRYRRCLFYVPRKNAKTTLAACIALYVFFEDNEPGAELYAAAAKEKQAKIVWRIARSMIVKEPKLVARLHRGKPYVNSILLDDEETFFQPIASEGKSEHGGSVHFAVIDELHAQANPDIMEAMRTGVGGRRQPLILLLTTADVVGESVCNEELEYAKMVRDNGGRRDRPGFDPSYLPVVFEASTEDDWTDPVVWQRVNPLYATSPTIRRTLEAECRTARDKPSYVNPFRRWYLNVQVESAVAFFDMAAWDRCGEPFDASQLRGRRCYAGGDLGETRDLTAFVLYFPVGGYILPWFWVPEEAANKREKRNDPIYRKWRDSGHLTITEGNVLDYTHVLEKVDEIATQFEIINIGLDLYNSRQLVQQFQSRGHECYEVRTAALSMNEPMKRLYDDLQLGRLRHGGHPVLRWNAANTKVSTDKYGNIAPVKPRSFAKIDGIVALAIAYGRAIMSPEPVESTVDDLYLDGVSLYA